MNELLFYAKVILFVVLVYDVGILFRKPEKGSKIAVSYTHLTLPTNREV